MGGGVELPRAGTPRLENQEKNQQTLLLSPDPNIHLHAVVDLGR